MVAEMRRVTRPGGVVAAAFWDLPGGDDADYGRLKEAVTAAGGELQRDAASQRFDAALAELPLPRVDLLPALRRALPGPDLFFQETVHLTPRGHEIVAEALYRFIEEQHLGTPEPARPSR